MSEYQKQLNYYYRHKGKWSYPYWVKRRLGNVKQRAKERGIPFDITIDDLVLNEICPVLGVPLEIYGDNQNRRPSFDRIRPERGYVKGNVRIISFQANRWKNDMTLEDANLLVSNWNKISA